MENDNSAVFAGTIVNDPNFKIPSWLIASLRNMQFHKEPFVLRGFLGLRPYSLK